MNEFRQEQLYIMETGWGPECESSLLADLLKQTLDDPTEVQSEDNPQVRRNAYKHRVHSLRCAYADARLRGIELEEQLAEANATIQNLQAMLQQIHATRWWKFRERCARCWHSLLSRLRHART